MSEEALGIIKEYDQIVQEERVRIRQTRTRIGNLSYNLYTTLNNPQNDISVSSVTFEEMMDILNSETYVINLRKHNALFIRGQGHYSVGERVTITTAYGALSFVLGGNFKRLPDGNVIYNWIATFSEQNGYEQIDQNDDDGYF
jgi:hypothetical protein